MAIERGAAQALHGGRVRAVRRARRRNGVRRAAGVRCSRPSPAADGHADLASLPRNDLAVAAGASSLPDVLRRRRRVSRRRERRRARRATGSSYPAATPWPRRAGSRREPAPGSRHPSGNVAGRGLGCRWIAYGRDRGTGPRTWRPAHRRRPSWTRPARSLYSAREDGAAQIGAQPCPARAGCCSRGEGRSNRWGVAKW